MTKKEIITIISSVFFEGEGVMNFKYFDAWTQKRIADMIEFDPYTALDLFDSYLRKYPRDCMTYPFYAATLTSFGRVEEASKVIELADDLARFDKVVSTKKHDNYQELIAYAKIKLFLYNKQYQEAYDFINNCGCKLDSINTKQVRYFCMKQLGLINGTLQDKHDKSYMIRQIIDYDYNDFLSHIEKHLAIFVEDYHKYKLHVFSLDFPINEVLEEIKKYIPSDRSLFTGFLDDRYVFKYDGCGKGYNENRLSDYFEIVAFHGTRDLITMYPVLNDRRRLDYIDINYLHDLNQSKVRRKSQIEKFDSRYKRS